MRKLFFIIVFSFVMFLAVAGPKEKAVKLAVMQGPTGFSTAFVDSSIDLDVYPAPTEAVAKLINGELDMAILPVNTAASLYNKGVKIKAVAVTGEGMLSVIGTNSNADTINVPGVGGTPDHMAKLLYSDKQADYSITAPAQLAQMLIAGKVKMAILPQPFVSMALRLNKNITIISDVQEEWYKKTKITQYPMSIFVVSGKFAKENSDTVLEVKNEIESSIKKVLSNSKEASIRIEQLGIMKASLAEPAIAECSIVFKEKEESKQMTDTYFHILYQLAPKSIGNKIPDNEFWL